MTRLEQMAAGLPELPDHVLVGLSGGADSVALLRLAVALRETRGITVEAVHVNHGLRGAASDGDEAFVRALCRAHDVPLYAYRATPPAHAGEDWARRARYGFFREAMTASGARALALAHHRDDQAETLLLHLLRGAGLNGLAGMAPDTALDGMRVLRPLLGISRQQLRDLLTDLGQDWREDATNAETTYLRNAVRHELLPVMERLAPGASARIAGTAALLRGTLDGQAAHTAAFLERNAGGDWLRLTPLLAEPDAMRGEILRAWWQRGPGEAMAERSLDRRQTEALCALAAGSAGGKCALPGRWQAQRGWKCLHLIPPERAAIPQPQPVADGARLGEVTLTILPGAGDPGDGRICQELPRALLAECELRTRRPGDFIRPFGSAGRQSLQDYLVNRHVDAPMRDRVPLVCRGSEVLLAAGVGAGDVPVWNEENEPVRLVWQGSLPWM